VPDPVPYPRAIAALALAAVLVGRGLSRALPGTVSGIGEAIDQIGVAGSILSQFGAMTLVALAVRGAAILLLTKGGQPGVKLLAAVGTAFVAVTSLFSALLAHNQLALLWSVTLAILITAIVATSALGSLQVAEKRAVALVALGVALTALVHTAARVVALLAAEQASMLGFTFARGLATFGFGLELSCLVAAGIWLLAPDPPAPRAAGAILILIAPALAVAATRQEGWGLVLGRTLEHLTAHPDPAVPRMLRYTAELWGVAAVGLCLAIRSRRGALMMVLALLLLGRSSADVPLGAVFLLNGALALQLLAPHGPDRRIERALG
jgi:hypothetical protein